MPVCTGPNMVEWHIERPGTVIEVWAVEVGRSDNLLAGVCWALSLLRFSELRFRVRADERPARMESPSEFPSES